jgi:hypothetical protein
MPIVKTKNSREDTIHYNDIQLSINQKIDTFNKKEAFIHKFFCQCLWFNVFNTKHKRMFDFLNISFL